MSSFIKVRQSPSSHNKCLVASWQHEWSEILQHVFQDVLPQQVQPSNMCLCCAGRKLQYFFLQCPIPQGNCSYIKLNKHGQYHILCWLQMFKHYSHLKQINIHIDHITENYNLCGQGLRERSPWREDCSTSTRHSPRLKIIL